MPPTPIAHRPCWALLVTAVVAALTSFTSPAQAQNVVVSAIASKTTVQPGDQLAIAVIFDHKPGWHCHTNDPKPPKGAEFDPIATELKPESAPAVTFGPIQWPESHSVMVDFDGKGPKSYAVFENRATAFIPVIIPAAMPTGSLVLTISATYQVCNDRVCSLPAFDEPYTVTLNVVAPGTAAASQPPDAVFSSFDTAIFSKMLSGTVSTGSGVAIKPVRFTVFGWSFEIDPQGSGLAILVFLAALGGFLLNLTPCVLPVIPIKIMGLSQVAGNPRRLLILGLAMSAGTVAFWLAIGLAIASFTSFKAINQLFQFPAFSLGVGVFIAVMGLGMLGLFTIRLPQSVYNVQADQGSLHGSFLFGIMTAVLSTPCTAPFMGSAAAWAATQPQATTMTVFAAIGAGMALPYVLLAAFPKLIEKIPRTGPASDLVKQVMGLLMVAVAAFFVGTGIDPLVRQPIDPPVRWHWWLIAAVVVVAMVWMLARTIRITPSAARRAAVGVLATSMSVAAVLTARSVTDRGPVNWVAYTPQRFEEAKASGKVVVLDFTAEWCLNCKALEAGVLHRDEVVKILNDSGVVAMRVDLTGNNTDGQNKLKELQWVGIPLLAIFGPNFQEPHKFDTYTVEVVRKSIEDAGGPRIAGRSSP